MTQLLIGDCMSESPRTIGDDQLLDSAKHVMVELGIRLLPVLNGGKIVGLLSDRDVKLAYAVEPERAKNMRVRDACAEEVFLVARDEPVKSVARTMAERGIGSALIADGDTVVGIFTTVDACRLLAEVV
jgi:acetoin utilization protein AcuB